MKSENRLESSHIIQKMLKPLAFFLFETSLKSEVLPIISPDEDISFFLSGTTSTCSISMPADQCHPGSYPWTCQIFPFSSKSKPHRSSSDIQENLVSAPVRSSRRPVTTRASSPFLLATPSTVRRTSISPRTATFSCRIYWDIPSQFSSFRSNIWMFKRSFFEGFISG